MAEMYPKDIRGLGGTQQVVATAAAAVAALSVADISHLYCNKLCAIGISQDFEDILLPFAFCLPQCLLLLPDGC